MLTGALGGASGSLPFAAAKAGVDAAPAPGDHKRFFCLSFLQLFCPLSSDSPGVLPVPGGRPGPRPVLLPARRASPGPRLGNK